MKKALKYILAIIWTAWTGALAVVTGVAMIVGMSTFFDRVLNNNVVAGVLLFALLVLITLSVGGSVKNLIKRRD